MLVASSPFARDILLFNAPEPRQTIITYVITHEAAPLAESPALILKLE